MNSRHSYQPLTIRQMASVSRLLFSLGVGIRMQMKSAAESLPANTPAQAELGPATTKSRGGISRAPHLASRGRVPTYRRPPDASKVSPVTQAESSDARKTA